MKVSPATAEARPVDYQPDHIIALFNRMAATYGVVNLVSSFGFSRQWRKACADALAPRAGMRCADLMCGMGEMACLFAEAGGTGLIVDAFDFSPAMCIKARATVARLGLVRASVAEADVLTLPGESSYDRIAVSFGLKTLDNVGLAQLAGTVRRLLRPGGRAAFVEIHLPTSNLLLRPYLFYLRRVIPLVGRLFLGDPDCYRSLAIYTEDFTRRDSFGVQLRAVGLAVTERPLFFGCARLYVANRA